MAIILGIETATALCSVALIKDGKLLSIRESEGAKEHSAALTGYIAEVFAEAGFTYQQMDAVAVSMGPGSYTGLRIGVSTAKGLCYALDKPFVAVDTLKAMTWRAIQRCKFEGKDISNALFIPMLDARRMEVYTAVFDHTLQVIEPVNALVVDEDSFAAFSERQIIYFGEGAEKCNPLFAGISNYSFMDHIALSGEAVCMLADPMFEKAEFADVAYCEPFYLKDFIAGKPRVKGLYS